MNETVKNNDELKAASNEAPVRIIIAGGGTGGHIFPAVAIANAIKMQQPNAEILFVGAKGKMEMEKVPQAGYEIKGLDIAGFNRSSLIKNIWLPFKLVKSFFQVRQIFNAFKPHAAVGVGGYSSFPVLKYAQSKGIPTFIHESNAFAGKSNIMLGKNATRVFVANEGMEQFFPKGKIMITGNPVRKSIAHSTVERVEAARFFNLDHHKKTILAVGGSLGAKSINEALENGLQKFADNDIQLIWQTGKTNAEQYQAKGKQFLNVWVDAFINQMELAYEAADVVISRAGAMAVTELCVVRKPSIFVPYPFAAEDHQTENAKQLVQADAALMVKDKEATLTLVETALALALDESRQQQLKINIAKRAKENADDVIAMEILKIIKA